VASRAWSPSGESLGPAAHDPWHVDQRLNVVDHGRLAVEPCDRRVGWAQADFAAAPFDCVQHRRLLAAHVAPHTREDRHVERKIAAEGAVAENTGASRVANRRLDSLLSAWIFGSDEDDASFRADRVGADRQAFEDRVWIVLHERAIEERPRIALVAVGDHEARVGRRGGAHAPFRSRRVGGAASPALTGALHDLEDLRRRASKRGGQPLIDPSGSRPVERGVIAT
jgi:hypothetical protein